MSDDINIDFRLDNFRKGLTSTEKKQMPFAMMLTINDLVKGSRMAAQGQMRGDLHNPTPFALRGIVFERATKRELSGRVVMYRHKARHGNLPAAVFLGPNVEGGVRSHKAFEKQLISRGYMLSSEYAVPASGIRLNRYGNVTQGMLNKIMSGIKIEYRGAGASRVPSSRRGKTKAKRSGRYFVARRGSALPPGIYFEKPNKKRTIVAIFTFRDQVHYKKRFDFAPAVQRHVKRNLMPTFNSRWSQVMASSR
ncbi:MAG: hypothetical protein ABJO86_00725 [Lentilitoribacter sp.]